MILHKETVETMGSLPVTKEVDFAIAPEAMRHVMGMLSNMYSNPYRAIAREYIANAVDAHRFSRAQGITPPAKIKITCPNNMSPTFEVRDFGPGMTVEDTGRLLSNFGASGEYKRVSDTMIGGFGIGSKCGFAVSDTFSFTVFHGGRKRVWICTTRDDAARALQMVVDIPSDEPTGVLVSVPIKHDGIVAVAGGIAYTTVGILDEEFDCGFEKVRWERLPVPGTCTYVEFLTFNDDVPSTVEELAGKSYDPYTVYDQIMVGDFIYPVDIGRQNNRCCAVSNETALGAVDLEAVRGNLRNMFTDGTVLRDWFVERYPYTARALSNRMILRFPAGSFKLAPNREQLILTEADKKTICGAFDKLNAAMEEELQKGYDYTGFDSLRVLRLISLLLGGSRAKTFPTKDSGETYIKQLLKDEPFIPAYGRSTPDYRVYLVRPNWERRTGPRFNRKVVRGKMFTSTTDYTSNNGGNSTNCVLFIDDLTGSDRSYANEHKQVLYADGKVYPFSKLRVLRAEWMNDAELRTEVSVYLGERKANGVDLDKEPMFILVCGKDVEGPAFQEAIKPFESYILQVQSEILKAPARVQKIRTGVTAVRGTVSAEIAESDVCVKTIQTNGKYFAKTLEELPFKRLLNIGGVYSEENASNFLWWKEVLKDAVPELRDSVLCTITKPELSVLKKLDVEVIEINKENFAKWVNTWAQAGFDVSCYGFEQTLLDPTYNVFHNRVTIKELGFQDERLDLVSNRQDVPGFYRDVFPDDLPPQKKNKKGELEPDHLSYHASDANEVLRFMDVFRLHGLIDPTSNSRLDKLGALMRNRRLDMHEIRNKDLPYHNSAGRWYAVAGWLWPYTVKEGETEVRSEVLTPESVKAVQERVKQLLAAIDDMLVHDVCLQTFIWFLVDWSDRLSFFQSLNNPEALVVLKRLVKERRGP